MTRLIPGILIAAALASLAGARTAAQQQLRLAGGHQSAANDDGALLAQA